MRRANVQARAMDPRAHNVCPSGLVRREEKGEKDEDVDDVRLAGRSGLGCALADSGGLSPNLAD